MKKFLCTMLCIVIFSINVIFIPYTTPVYAAGEIAGDVAKSLGFDTLVKFVKTIYSVGYNIASTGSGDGSAASKSLDSIWGEDSSINKWLQTKLFPFMDSSGNIDLTKEDCPITYNNEKQLVEFNPTFTNELTQQVQDSVHALDGYYYIVPPNTVSDFLSCDSRFSQLTSTHMSTLNQFFSDSDFVYITASGSKFPANIYSLIGFDNSNYFYVETNSSSYTSNVAIYGKETSDESAYISDLYAKVNFNTSDYFVDYSGGVYLPRIYNITHHDSNVMLVGAPIKIFYSKQDLENYLNKGQTYAPKLPSGGIKIPITYINNNVDLPDLNINLDSLIGKAEADIQADIDLALKNYLDKLADINVNPPSNPTPTPSHGGTGGDFGDGTIPTPTPAIGDGGDDSGNGKVDMTETNNILKDILNKLTAFKETTDKNFSDFLQSSKSFFDSTTKWLTSFGDSHTKFEQTLSKYLETNNGKLDQIIDAIDKLSQGKEDGEDYKCKYDYSQLSSFLTSLWNDSDKKFETMIDLLEENNEYQKKLVDTLDSIKSILIKQTIMDSFKDRSKETADKAKEKFPTSVPWDIAIIINAMSAEPKDPKFNLPIKVDSMNIDETIEVDLSSGEWANLAKTCRYMLSLLFVLFMVQLSRKLFFSKGDDD